MSAGPLGIARALRIRSAHRSGLPKEPYAMFGFNDSAHLVDGSMWPIAYAVTKLTAADEGKLGKLVKKAAS